ncbi:Ig-like domain repeat protein [Methanobrevibacter arboriphilus]|uniref:Ig-like domain repeat protein n=1 Tax=Methanobrevibacter arboriphilus TaxID=39441 RepID=UPI000A65C0CD|nr:Ig-like domain repeat protein [Methanobrevibacter arboriphilus]
MYAHAENIGSRAYGQNIFYTNKNIIFNGFGDSITFEEIFNAFWNVTYSDTTSFNISQSYFYFTELIGGTSGMAVYTDQLVTINYTVFNRIDTSLNFSQILFSDSGNFVADYNFWGLNSKPSNVITNNYFTVNIVPRFDKYLHSVVFDYILALNDSDTYIPGLLPLNMVFNDSLVNNSTVFLGSQNYSFVVPLREGPDSWFVNTTFSACSLLFSFDLTLNDTILNLSETFINNSTRNVFIKGTLFDVFDNRIDGSITLSIFINNTLIVYAVPVVNGLWNLTLDNIDFGYYQFFVEYSGSLNYTNSSILGSFSDIENSNVTIITDPYTNLSYGDFVTISGRIEDTNGTPIDNYYIYLITNDNDCYMAVVNNGNWSFNLQKFIIGKLYISIVFNNTPVEGVGEYNNYSVNYIIEYNLAIPVVIVNSVTDVVYGDNFTVSGNVTGVGGSIPIGIVTIHFNDGTNVTVGLNTDGTWNYTFNTTDSSVFVGGVGHYIINVTYSGDNNYSSTVNSGVSFNVLPTAPVVIVDPVNDVLYGDNVTVSGNVTGITGGTGVGVVPTGNVTIHFNDGTNTTVAVNSDGTWSYTFNTTNSSVFAGGVGSYVVNVTYNGDNNYNSTFNNSVSFSILPVTSVVIVDPVIDVVYGDNFTVSGIVSGVGLVPTGNVTVNITDEYGVSYTVNLTLIDGVFSVTLNSVVIGLSAGEYLVNVTYNGDNNYNSTFNDDVSFNVSLLGVNSTIIIPDSIKSGHAFNITGVLLDSDGNPLSGVDLNITINNASYTVVTGDDGVWSYAFTPDAAGEYIVSVGWIGNSNYTNFTNISSFFCS